MRYASAGTLVDEFIIGRRPGEHGVLRRVTRLCRDFARFALVACSKRYDLVHINPSLNVKSALREAVFVTLLRGLSSMPYVIFFRGWDERLAARITRSAVYKACLRWLVGGAAKILVLSDRFRASLSALGIPAEKIVVTSTMFDGDGLKPFISNGYRLDSRDAILFLGRLVREKGCYELLDAFARVSDEFPSYTLVVAGDGPEAAGLRVRASDLGIRDRVVFPGYVRGAQKYQLLARTRVFVLPTYHSEGMPNALIEAMAAGSAVIASAAGAIPEIAVDRENGVLLKGISPQEIENALRAILTNDVDCAGMGARNMAMAWPKFEAGVVVNKLEKVYSSVLQAQQPQTASHRDQTCG